MVSAERGAVDLVVRTNMLLPGVYAWISTVATPAFRREVSWGPKTVALVALCFLVAGPLVALSRPSIGRALGIYGFVAASLLTWLLVSPEIGVDRIEPIRASLGAAGWALFALGWGAVRPIGQVPEDDPNAIVGAPLAARGHLPGMAFVVLGVGLAGALVPLFLAWRVIRPDHALFGHAVAVACALALLSASARIAVDRAKWQPASSASARINAAAGPLMLLGVVLAMGFVWLLLR
jgi:hypothetical protein